MATARSHRHFFFFILALTLLGFFIFSSASLGLLNRGGASYGRIILSQLIILLFALGAMLLVAKYDYHGWRRLALPLFIAALALNLLVFVPGIGFESGGANRWISLGSRTFQPSEFLKLAFVIYLAAWLTKSSAQLKRWEVGLLPFLILVSIVGGVLIAEPDLGTFFILVTASISMFFAAAGRLRHILLVGLAVLLVASTVIAIKPYARNRVLTFLNPEENALGQAYQINQSLIAIGSGGWFGRGPGQSIHKFFYLPEPIGDSIFAVAGEEFGFLGGLTIILAFTIFGLWSFSLARRAPDDFGSVLAIGVTILILASAFINMASMLGLIPLTGLPLSFVSHGGSSLLFSLAGCGIILSIAKQVKRR